MRMYEKGTIDMKSFVIIHLYTFVNMRRFD